MVHSVRTSSIIIWNRSLFRPIGRSFSRSSMVAGTVGNTNNWNFTDAPPSRRADGQGRGDRRGDGRGRGAGGGGRGRSGARAAVGGRRRRAVASSPAPD